MSDKKNVVKTAENEKVMTKYDLKMQRRKEEAQKARREEIKGLIIGIVLVVALAAFVLSFPIRSYLAVNGQYIKVGGEKVTKVEFDMQYNVSKNTYIQQMGYYLSMFGMTDTSTLEYQAYDDNMTFGDYFAQMAAEGLVEQRGLTAKAEEAGFTYDTTEDLEAMKASLEAAAAEAEPEIAPNSAFAPILVTSKAPGSLPRIAITKSTSRLATPPWFIRLPARIKKGIAVRLNLLIPTKVLCAPVNTATSSSTDIRIAASEETPIA